MAKKNIRKRKKNHKNLVVFSGLVSLMVGVVVSFGYNYYVENNYNTEKLVKRDDKKIDLVGIKKSYHDFVKLQDGASIYVKKENGYEVASTAYGDIEISLDSTYEVVDKYFKVLDSDYYVKYNEVSAIDRLSAKKGEYKYYNNYIVYNENVVLKDGAKLYISDNNYYEVNGGSYPIIIKDSDRYGIEYNNSLVYVNSNDIKSLVESTNTDLGHTDGLAVLNYHFTVSASNENGELNECVQSICITDTMFDSHIKYLKDNGYYAVSMRDLELFIDGKIQLPEKSVSITIDDGWYVARSIAIFEKYQILGTLFLIGSLASPNDYVSEYLEVHSHTWGMHGLSSGDDCPNSSFRGGITCFDEKTILEDLKKSRESLNNTTYFCYPFYDYNERAISLLKQAGFTMAFAGEFRDNTVRVGQDKYKIPRYVITKYTTMENFISYVS